MSQYRTLLTGFLILGLCLTLGPATGPAAEKPAGAPIFEKDVLPVFQAKCLKCHGDELRKADLDLRSKPALIKGGETGPVVSPGSPERSTIWVKVAGDKMPPGKAKLTEAEKELLRAWIEGGAKDDGTTAASVDAGAKLQITEADRQFWSFRPPVRPPVPSLSRELQASPRAAWPRNPIDQFILARLLKAGLQPSPEADKPTLLRRASFDLRGLSPSPKEIDDFLADAAPDAYEQLIDRLLATPEYGERWGRHWLDVAGYADSEGILDADYVRTAAWRYRDYVIQAFNQDKPYDRFLKEQIAGDELTDYWTAYRTQKELPPEVLEGLIATGFVRCASDTSRPDFVTIKNAPGYYFQTLDDTVRIVASSTLGLTVHCAKCHSHKYDPIPQSDYYRVQAVFKSAYRPSQWIPQVERKRPEATEAQEKEAKEHNAKVDAAVAALKKQADDWKKQFADRLFVERLAKLPEAIRDDVKTAIDTDPAKRNEVQKYLAGKFQKELRPDAAALSKSLAETYPDYAGKAKALDAAMNAESAKRRTFPEIRALYDLPGEVPTHVLRRGDYLNPGPEVQPGVLSVLATPRSFGVATNGVEQSDSSWVTRLLSQSSGRRLAFAEWLTQPEHPLTARVMVNRIWLHHLGEGIVATPDNFGRTGSPPSHPELLDWLATEFVASGWSVKAMHRLIMTSSTYRQSSAVSDHQTTAAAKIDPDNRLLWRQRLRRLEAEALRDATLSVGGNLNSQRYGPPVPMVRQGDGEVVAPGDASGLRRSVYLQVRRSQPLTLLQVFDQPVMETNCARRPVSTVSSQALTLLNSEFLARQAATFAERVQREAPADPAGYAIKLAFARSVTVNEQVRLTAFLDEQAARYLKAQPGQAEDARRRALVDLCHMLLSANEFAYVD